MTRERTSVLDVTRAGERLHVGFFDEASTVRSYEDVLFPSQGVEEICNRIRALLDKSSQLGGLSSGTLAELKGSGQSLFEQILPASLRGRLLSSSSEYLVFQIDESLVSIPWELLFDGREFLCLRFNTGRRMKTQRVMAPVGKIARGFPLRMLILADPQGNLPCAAQEAQAIRREMDMLKGKILASSRVKDIPPDYVTQHIHDYDVLHYAGHAEADGWVLAGGKMTAAAILAMGTRPLPGLIFMNSCQSAQEKGCPYPHDPGQPLFSLANAFLVSGVRHVIGTLWRIADDAALILAKEFYRQLASGCSVGRALKAARRKAINDQGDDHLLWASYVLYGDPAWSWQTSSAQADGKRRQGLFLRWILGAAVAGLGLLSLLGVMSPLLQWKDGLRSYIREDYGKAAQSLAGAAASPAARFFPAIALSLCQRAGHASAMAQDYEGATVFYEKAINLATSRRKKAEAAQLSLALAETAFEKNIFIDLFGPGRRGEKHTPQEILAMYQEVYDLAGELADTRLQARALVGMARVEESKDEWDKAILDYEKAAALLEPDATDLTARLLLLRMDLALAHAHGNHRLDFAKAYGYLQKLPVLAPRGAEIKDVATEWSLLKRRFESFLRTLAEKGYKNSDFYKKAGAIYDRLQ